MTLIIIMLVVLFTLLIIGVPVGIALAGSSMLWVLMSGSVPDFVVIHRMVNGVDSFPLLAIPFFILAGNLMNSAGITNRIFAFATSCIGWLRGGLGHVNIIASVLFAGMSGAAVADAGGLGTIEIKAMRDAGYDDDFAVAVTAASSTIGPIIPPSLPMVVYGVMASASVGQLFAAGFIPGLLMAVALMLLVAWYAKKRNYPRDTRFNIRLLGKTFKRAFLSLLTPVIIVGGILTGAFTPTEAAISACAYALLLGIVVYRTLTWKRLLVVSMDTIETSAIICFIVAAASIFAWILTSNRVTEHFTAMLMTITAEPDHPAHPAQPGAVCRRLLHGDRCRDHHSCSGTAAGRRRHRHRSGPFRGDHGAQPDDRTAHAARGHGTLRVVTRFWHQFRTLHQRHAAVSFSPGGRACPYHLCTRFFDVASDPDLPVMNTSIRSIQ